MSIAREIFDNAIASIELGIEDYKKITNDERRVLSAVRNIFAGILLLFKSKLAELSKNDDEALIKEKILPKQDGTHTKWVGVGNKTVDYQQIKERFDRLDIKISWDNLGEIKKYRNDIEHYFDAENRRIAIVGQYITKSFIVICSFIRDYLGKDPKDCFSNDIWDVFINEQKVYDAELKETQENLKTLKWPNPRIAKIFLKFLCPKCSSSLIAATETDCEPMSCEFQCRSCSSVWDYDQLIKIICDSMKDRSPEEYDEPIVRCPECCEKAYSPVLGLCFKCDVCSPFRCERCDDIVPTSELECYEDTRMCGYCTHMQDSLMRDDD